MILYSAPLVKKVERKILKATVHLKTKPLLAVVLIGKDPASLSYIRQKSSAAERVGCAFKLFSLPGNTAQTKVVATIKKLNHDKRVTGIIVQLPAPKKFDAEKIVQAIAPEKDVDNLRGDSPFTAPAVQAIWQILSETKKPTKETGILIVGYGRIIGKPLHAFLMKKGFSNITIADKNTKNISALTKKVGIIVSGVGKANLITEVKKGAVVIDAGASRYNGKITGDVALEHVAKKAAIMTPVPGGVGPLTVSYLFRNLLGAWDVNRIN